MAGTSIVPLSGEDCADEFAGGAGDDAFSSRIACEHGFMKLRACLSVMKSATVLAMELPASI